MFTTIALAVTVLAGWQPTSAPREWAWFRASSADRSWFLTQGRATVEIAGGRFEAMLYDKDDPQFRRVHLRGTATVRTVNARVRVEESDTPEFNVSGRLRRLCWSAGGGRELLLLSDGSETIGLFRELPVSATCRPA